MKIGCFNRSSLTTLPEPTLPILDFAGGKQKKKKPSNFYLCIQPVYITSRAFGVLPFTIHYNSQHDHIEKVSVNMFDIVWFFGSILINLLLAYWVLSTLNESSSQLQSAILLFGGRVLLIVGLLTSPLAIVLDMINRNRWLQIANGIFAFDKEVRMFSQQAVWSNRPFFSHTSIDGTIWNQSKFQARQTIYYCCYYFHALAINNDSHIYDVPF